MYQQQKRHNMAADRLSDFKLGMASYVKRMRTGVALGGLKLQCIRNFYSFFYQSTVLSSHALNGN